jgi:hypothetical protein
MARGAREQRRRVARRSRVVDAPGAGAGAAAREPPRAAAAPRGAPRPRADIMPPPRPPRGAPYMVLPSAPVVFDAAALRGGEEERRER